MKTVLLLAWLGAFSADGVSGHLALHQGGRESHPFLTQSAITNDVVLAGVGGGTAAVWYRYYDQHPRLAKWLAVIVIGIHTTAAVHNARQLQ